MAIFEIQSDVEEIEKNTSLFEEISFDKRAEAIDFLEFHIIDQLEGIIQNASQTDKLIALKSRAEYIKAELEEINIKLFQKLRTEICAGKHKGTAFKSLVKKYTGFNLDDDSHRAEPGYDNLDLFINGLFPIQNSPEPQQDLEPEMVFYQKTPARVVFELVEKVPFGENDVFVDLGSGLGQVAILVNLLTGITTKGIEFEPAFCNYANDCAVALNLSNVTFINTDARKSDYSEGTVFFMYTPFKGDILRDVLLALKREAQLRKIKIFTYGPCTADVASQSWLHCEEPVNNSIYKLAVFTSLPVGLKTF